MKSTKQLKPNYAPVYAAALFPDLAKLFQDRGYALAVHGSLARDFDVIGIPWTDKAANPFDIVEAVTKQFAITQIGKPERREHGRLVFTLSLAFGECAMDLSFMPRVGSDLSRNSEWDCDKSPTGKCEYEEGSEYCTRCCQPSERK